MCEEVLHSTPPEISKIANDVTAGLIPTKSRKVYQNAYEKFLKWTVEHNVKYYSENVLLAYFENLSKKLKSSTLWAQYSMIKAQLNLMHNIDIGKYNKLIAFLKRQNEGYKPKKSKVLNKEQFDNFLLNAPNREYLATKVVLIFGIAGACRCHELLRLEMDDIKDLENLILVNIPNTKTNKPRSFSILGDVYINLYREYAALRPKDINFTRFFIKFQNGKCHKVVMGIHKISSVARDVASYLKLPNPSQYTGHCLRRTSATLLVDNGGDITCLKRHGGWKSDNIAEGYIDESLSNKKATAMKILNPQGCSTSATIQSPSVPECRVKATTTTTTISTDTEMGSSGFNTQNCSINNCTFNITINK